MIMLDSKGNGDASSGSSSNAGTKNVATKPAGNTSNSDDDLPF
jgi:hypothetical protein